MPPSSNNHGAVAEAGDGGREDAGGGIERGLGHGGGVAYGVEGSNGSSGAGEQKDYNGSLEGGETARAGGGAAEQGDQELELERVGYLIEVSVVSYHEQLVAHWVPSCFTPRLKKNKKIYIYTYILTPWRAEFFGVLDFVVVYGVFFRRFVVAGREIRCGCFCNQLLLQSTSDSSALPIRFGVFLGVAGCIRRHRF